MLPLLAILAFVGCRSTKDGFVANVPPPSGPVVATTNAGTSNADATIHPASYDEANAAANPSQSRVAQQVSPSEVAESTGTPDGQGAGEQGAIEQSTIRKNTVEQGTVEQGTVETLPAPEEIATPDEPLSLADADSPTLDEVIQSVVNHFPLIREAAANRVIASGEALSAAGAFDRKVDGFGNVQPLDFFENHWYQLGVSRDTLWGGKLGAGYKLGRGSFEPWFLERETNDLGEFSIKMTAPIGRDVRIDENRSELWQAQVGRSRVEPIVRSQVIMAVQDGVKAYWDWIAAGAQLRIANSVLRLGLNRADFLARQVEEGEKAEIDLIDNRRIIVSRQAKQIDARRKLEQAAVKLSLFLRSPAGVPVLAPVSTEMRDFPSVTEFNEEFMAGDIQFAVANRPELADLSLARRQLNIALQQAINETRADLDAGLLFAQDVGNPTASDNKSEFEIEATLLLSVPLERRKALGKVRQLRGKLAQLQAKTQFTADKIGVEVQVARAAIRAAAERVEQTTEGFELAQRMQQAERRLYDEGQSTLFNLNLREQQAAEAAADLVTAQLDYFVALADYAAALGVDPGDLVQVIEPESEGSFEEPAEDPEQ
ncbi:MAG: TolC family protein [Planctomycetota bacterium]